MLLFQTFYAVPFMNLRNRKGGALFPAGKQKSARTGILIFSHQASRVFSVILGFLHVISVCMKDFAHHTSAKTESVLQVNRFRGETRNRPLFQFVTPV